MEVTDRAALLASVRELVHARVLGEAPPEPLGRAPFDETRSLFVTLRVAGELRGCIGTLAAREPLGRTALQAAASALRDQRFEDRRIQPAELHELQVEVQLLGPLEPVQAPGDIEIGRHGVVVEHGRQAGVFLPQVAVELGWDAEQTLQECCRNKLRLPADAWRLPESKLFVFETLRLAEGPA